MPFSNQLLQSNPASCGSPFASLLQFNELHKFQTMKSNSGRVSFAGLKNQRNKENELSFNNVRGTFVNSHSQNLAVNCSPGYPKAAYEVQIKAKEPSSSSISSTRFADAIRQKSKASVHRSEDWLVLEEKYERAQGKIRAQIELCNMKYSAVSETIADLHIRDLMKFNELLTKNEQMYCKWVDSEDIQAMGLAAFSMPSLEDHRLVNEIEKAISMILSEKNKPFDCRSTYESKNKKTVSGQSSRVSPQLIKQSCSPLRLVKNISEDSDKLAQSLRQAERNGNAPVTQNTIKQKGCLEDTPESVKSKISQTSKIRVEKVPVIGMFDRINICESVEHQEPIEPLILPNSRNKIRKDYRYGSSSQQ